MTQDYKDECGNAPPNRIASEIRQFSALGAWYLMQSSPTVQSSVRLAEVGSQQASTTSGRYLASRYPLAAHGQVERLIRELRSQLNGECEGPVGASRNDLLQLWMSVESSLTTEERQQLSPAILERLFPENRAPSHLSRDGAQLLGGY